MPLLFLAIPLAAAVVLSLAIKLFKEKGALWVPAGVAVLQMGLSSYYIGKCLENAGSFSTQFIKGFSVDTLSAFVLFAIGLMAFISLLVAKSTVEENRFDFSVLMLLIILGMNGLVMVRDIFSLYVFVEITSTVSFILIGFKKGKNGLAGAFKYYMMSAIATMLILTSIAFIFMFVGSTGFDSVAKYLDGQSGKYNVEILVSLILFTAGLAIKSGAVPFHTWVPNAYSSSPASVSVLLAGIVTKVSGVYALMRIYRDVFHNNIAIGNVLMVIGIASILLGAFAAIAHKDMKRMLAYSSISQIGYIILGIGTGSMLGFIGAAFHFFNHATFKSMLFVNHTAIELRTGKRDMDKMGGLAEKMPVTAGSAVIGFLSTAGIPPLSGFWSKLLIILAAWEVSRSAAIVALVASALTLWYFLVLQRKVYFGAPSEELKAGKEAPAGILSAEVLLSAVNIAVGLLFPFILIFLNGKSML